MKAPPAEFDLALYLDAERARVDAALEGATEDFVPFLPDPLREPVRAGLLAPGKRLRPILCLAAYRACLDPPPSEGTEAPEAMYSLSAALELIHAYSLMHDDLPCMDDAPLRRGRPTPHTRYGVARTTVAAAALIPGAARQAWHAAGSLGLADSARHEIVGTLLRAAGPGGMVGGQGLDLLGEGARLTREELDRLHGMKTGALLTAALLIGGIAGSGTPPRRSALERYGREIGLAFQIVDDLLDATADAKTLGKEPSDHALEKSTYVSLLGVDAARDEAIARVDAAAEALRGAGIASPALLSIARYVVERDR